jgi:ribosomal protein S18 acetylase RimI-like enzyme
MRPLRIEEAALNAWPALQHILYDGWLLRFSHGYTKRANSVNVLYAGALDLDEKIARCETEYRARDLPSIFRITSFNAPPDLDASLERRGYARHSPTLVLGLELAQRPTPHVPAATLHSEALDPWLAQFCDLRGSALDQHDTHRRMLAAIPGHVNFATLRTESEAVAACGIAVAEGTYVGLFDLITDPAQRGQGYGSALVASLLAWAESAGARYAYLQVEEDNDPARRVYEAKFGYDTVYWYWYRIRTLAK